MNDKWKRVFSLLAVFLILATIAAGIVAFTPGVSAAIVPQHQGGCTQTASNTKTCTITMTISAGDTVVVTISNPSTTNAVSSVTGGGTYTKKAQNTNTGVKIELWATGIGASTSASSVVVTMSRIASRSFPGP